MNNTLHNKRAIVTGGNTGIGLATVKALAASGAEVTFTARSNERLATAMEALQAEGINTVQGILCDATNHKQVTSVMNKGFDILINNAGIIGPIGRITDTDVSDWRQNIEVNLVSAFLVIQQAIISMQSNGGGTIVNLSSGAAHRAMEGWSAYCAGKAALAMLTQSVHLEYAEKGIRVFGFAPGVVDTNMQVNIRASGINPVSQIKREDLASAAEPAQAIAWLCSQQADALCGQELDVRNPQLRESCGLPALAQ